MLKKISAFVIDRAYLLVLLLLVFLILTRIFISYDWRVIHDSAIFLYGTQLMHNFDIVPYLGLHEENTPLTYLMYYGIGKLFGFDNFGWRLFDYLFMFLMFGMSYLCIRSLNRRAALLGALLFIANYLVISPTQSLQREYLILLPMAISFLVAKSSSRLLVAKHLLLGLCVGIMTNVKLEFSVYGAVLFLGYFYINSLSLKTEWRKWLLAALSSFVAFLLPFVLCYFYLLEKGALEAFWKIFRDYWPLYRDISLAELYFVHPMLYFFHYLRTFTMFGLEAGYWPLITQILFLIAFYRFYMRQNNRESRVHDLLIFMLLASMLVPFIPFKFFLHHFFPLMFFLSLFFPLILCHEYPKEVRPIYIFVAIISVMGISLRIFDISTSDYFYRKDRVKAADQITKYLKNVAHVQKGELIQPVGWTDNGVVLPVIEVEAKLPTRFIYGYQFYHHTSTPYIQGIRKEFVEELTNNPPRFLIEAPYMTYQLVGTHKDQVSFPEYEKFRQDHYHFVMKAKNYWGGLLLWERNIP